ncbi:ABC-type Fe2+-enterobactin transport system substrate-binding protein [Rhodococcus sp. 27YEA15]|uniref:Fe2+-enterobactin ABC transporter substrate-binding protein n=1 Tax=Rhodococcus sp. 27YEA15 TaxID=3156259 RepID=UPI003C7D6B7A
MGVGVKKPRTFRVLSVMLVAGLALIGCSSGAAGSEESPTAASGSWPRSVETVKGAVEIPAKPQRVVSTSVTLTGSLLAIDAPVIASGATGANTEVADEQGFFTQWGDVARERAVTPLASGVVNAEAVIALDPDLIVVAATGGDSFADLYEQFSKIAPTIVVDYGGNSWQEVTTELGRATGLEENATAAVDRFENAVTSAKATLTLPPQPTTALVYVESDGGGANVWTADSAQSKLLTELGFTMAEIPESVKGNTSMGARNDIVQVSAENLYDAIAGNTVILVNADDSTVAKVEGQPLLARHRAVTGKSVYPAGLDTFRLDYYSATNMVNRLVTRFG